MIRTIEWRRGTVVMLDQRLLPRQEVYRVYRDYRDVARAIREMVVRGAPAIGVAAAMGVALGARSLKARSFDSGIAKICLTLESTRPTAVNLRWAIHRMRSLLQVHAGSTLEEKRQMLEAEALEIQREDIAANRALGAHGAELLPDRGTVLTYCNAGALATAGYGTALGVVRAARSAGKRIDVIAAETRPFLQGARLTAWELRKDRIPVTLIADGAVGSMFQRGGIDAVIVGTDRTAANGDVANKVGTYGVAVLARLHRVPFYVAAPTSSIDLDCRSGAEIPIEERAAEEVTHFAGESIAPSGVRVANPAFDVTPSRLVTALVTERGIVSKPYRRELRRLLGD